MTRYELIDTLFVESEMPDFGSLTFRPVPDKKMTCSICGKEDMYSGHNAFPVNDGMCCNECDRKYVIPMRIIIENCKDYIKQNSTTN